MTPPTRSRKGQLAPTRRHAGGRAAAEGEPAVTEVLGSILLVGITVVTAAGLGLIIFAFEGPQDTLHIDLELRIDPGVDADWDTGDEKLQLRHLGGEAMQAGDTVIAYENAGSTTTHTGTSGAGALGSAFSDGELTIGETWESPDDLELAQDEVVAVDVVGTAGESTLLATGEVTGRGVLTGGASGCAPDVADPTSSWTNVPDNFDAAELDTTLTVTLTGADNCDLNESATVTIKWGYSTPPTDFTDTMTGPGPAWTYTLPAQVWTAHSGDTIYWQAFGIDDTAGNTANSAIGSEFIDPIVSTTYVDTIVAAGTGTLAGAVSGEANAKTDDGMDSVATLAEGSVVTTATGTLVATSTTGSSGVTSPTNAYTNDNTLRATMDTVGDVLQTSAFTYSGGTAGIRQVLIGADVSKSSAGGSSPTFTLSYKTGGTGGTAGATTFQQVLSATSDTTYTVDVTNDRAWTSSDISGLVAVLTVDALSNRNILVDQLFVQVVYATTGSGLPQAGNFQLDWTGVPTGSTPTYTLELRYKTDSATSDTFTVQLFEGGSGTSYRTCATLSATTSFLTAECTLQGNEYNSGAPRVRILDGTPTSTTAATLSLDYARVVSE